MATVVISGITGFLGSHLARHFIAKDYQIYGLKRQTSRLDKLHDIESSLNFIDVDKSGWESALQMVSPDIVIHAACSYGRQNESITSLLQTNVLFGVQLLEASIKAGAPCFINADSALPLEINNYALSKFQFKQWGKSLQEQIQFINLRIEHMYGVGDDDRKFIHWLIEQMRHGTGPIKLTNGTQKRDFIYIDDVVSAFNLIIESRDELSQYAEIDLATGDFIAVKDFVLQLKMSYLSRFPNSTVELVFGAIAYRENELMLPDVKADYLKSLGWRPQIDYKSGIEKLVEEL